MKTIENVRCQNERCGYVVLVGENKHGAVFKLDGKFYCYDCILQKALYKCEELGVIKRIGVVTDELPLL